MAEGGDTEDQRRWRRVRLMSPYPSRPFQAYNGPPVAEGSMFASLRVSTLPFRESLDFLFPIFRNQAIMFRADCAFDPYSEECITASVDMQILMDRLVSLNANPTILMSRFFLRDEKRCDIPYRRSRKSASTAFCSDGNLIAWPGFSCFCVYDRSTEMRKTVNSFYEILCGAFSPCGGYLALLTSDVDLLVLRIVDSYSHKTIASGFYLPDYFPYSRPYSTHFEDSSIHLLWSKCGKYLGMSTYYQELIVFKVKSMIETNSIDDALTPVPVTGYHKNFYDISHPKAYDFKTFKSQTNQVTLIAVGTVENHILLFEIRDDNVSELLNISHYPSRHSKQLLWCIIDCLRYSNAQDLLAVAMSNGIIDLLDSESLHPMKTLEPAVFLVELPRPMPMFHGFSCLSFACSDNFLAAGATDGRVRVWCVRRVTGPLMALCRTAIRCHCKIDDMSKLLLPDSIVSYLMDPAF